MTDWSRWFQNQLQTSADGFVWAFSQIKPEWHDVLPPDPDFLGRWTAARHIWHVTEYERCFALPSMCEWMSELDATLKDWPDDDDAWAAVENRHLDELVAAFRQVRHRQIEMLTQFSPDDWTTPRETLWGEKPLSMVVTKTFQHTYEHDDTLLRMGLWWEETLQEEHE